MARGPASAPAGRSSTRCTSARSRPRARGRRRPSSCRRCAELGVTIDRDDAGRRFPGAFGWGYDGVNLYAPTRLYGTPDDLRARSSIARTRSARRDPRRRLQPPRARTATTCSEFAPSTSPTATRTNGAKRINFEGPPAGAGVLRRERRLLDRRVPSRRPAPRRDAGDQRRVAPNTCSRRSARARARRPAAADRIWSRRTSRRTRARASAGRRAATASTRSGTTTSTTPRCVALTGRREAYYTRLHAARRRSSCRREVRLPLSGAAVRAGRSSRAARRRSICRPTAFVGFLENHDQVANSAFGTGCIHADLPGHAIAR